MAIVSQGRIINPQSEINFIRITLFCYLNLKKQSKGQDLISLFTHCPPVLYFIPLSPL